MDNLGTVAADVAAKAAIQYLRGRDILGKEWFNADAISKALQTRVKLALPEALKDAKEALDLGMGPVGETTFMVSMALAGIKAAKDVYPEA